MKNSIIGISALLCFTTCGIEHVEEQEKLEPVVATEASIDRVALSTLLVKLAGEWHDIQEDGNTVFNEQWASSDGGRYTGLGFVMSGIDTVFIEHLSIIWDDTSAHYSARVPSQNNGADVVFKLTEVSAESMVFTNVEHDFPQRIAYTHHADTVWDVVVSGVEEGLPRTEKFHFKRR